jgi:hypothetical protein
MIVMVAVIAAAVLTIIHLLRLLAMLVLHATIRKAIDRDPDGAGAAIERLAVPSTDGGDDRVGMLLITAGIAIVVGSVIIGDTRWLHYAVATALFPLLMGTALWARHLWLKRQARGQ